MQSKKRMVRNLLMLLGLPLILFVGCNSDGVTPGPTPGVKKPAATEASFGIGVGSRTDIKTGKIWAYGAKSDGGVARLSEGVIDGNEFVAGTGPFELSGSKDTEDALNAMVHNLRVGYAKGPISPFGLTNDRFGFHMFWDADVWVFPALSLTDPEVARRIPEMRYGQREKAWENFLKWQKSGYPVASGNSRSPLPELAKLAGERRPLMFAWETVDGSELAPNPDTKFQHHVTGGVAWMMHRAIQLGLVDSAKGEEVIKGCAAFYLWRMDKNPDGSYGLRNVVSPDEWHTVNNDLYTNAIADWTIRRAFGSDIWPRGKVKFPRRGNTFATFDGDTYDEYQQAAALLAVFPLEHPDIWGEGEEMYKMYRGKHSKNGPAMSSAIDSVVAARLGKWEDAVKDFDMSWKPFTDDPRIEFREKPGTGESYFLTGAAACLNAAIYGMFQVYVSDEQPAILPWYIPLKSGSYLVFSPHQMPNGWDDSALTLIVDGKELKLELKGGSLTAYLEGKLIW